MSRGRTGGFFRRAFLVLVLAALAVGAWYWTRYQGFSDAPLVGIEAGDSLVVKRGDSLDKVLRTLQAQGVDTGETPRPCPPRSTGSSRPYGRAWPRARSHAAPAVRVSARPPAAAGS